MKALARLNRFGFGTAPAETLTLATGNKKTPSGRSPTNTPTRANNCEGATSAKTRRDFPSLPPRRRPALMKPVGIIPELAHSLNASEEGRGLSPCPLRRRRARRAQAQGELGMRMESRWHRTQNLRHAQAGRPTDSAVSQSANQPASGQPGTSALVAEAFLALDLSH